MTLAALARKKSTRPVNALSSFRDQPGEHPVARAVRRKEHVERELPLHRHAREEIERATAHGVLIGATLQQMATAAEVGEVMAQLEAAEARTAQLAAELVTAAANQHAARGRAIGNGLALFLLGAGAAFALSRRRR